VLQYSFQNIKKLKIRNMMMMMMTCVLTDLSVESIKKTINEFKREAN
jgi:tRNA U38,U39,U40 pseudouridine synthase TruA